VKDAKVTIVLQLSILVSGKNIQYNILSKTVVLETMLLNCAIKHIWEGEASTFSTCQGHWRRSVRALETVLHNCGTSSSESVSAEGY